MTCNNVSINADTEGEENLSILEVIRIFFKHHFGYLFMNGEDEVLFRAYYYKILIRHLRLTFILLTLLFLLTTFVFMYPFAKEDKQFLFAIHLVYAMLSLASLAFTFRPFFRRIWKLYVFLFAAITLVLGYSSADTITVTLETTMLAFITVCLVSGLPFLMCFSLIVCNFIVFEFSADHNGAYGLRLLRYNSFFLIYACFLLYAAHAREAGIRSIFQTLEDVKKQRHKSDSIIQHMLPPFVVKKLKAKHDTVIVDHFDSVTVMFCEIVNFNALLEKMPAQEVVQLLNDVYTAFDRLTDSHGVNKVEHIGNVYVVSAGCPEVTPFHSGRVAEMGLKMLSVVRHFKKVEIRLGIHTGAVMAGVIGFKKLSYHLFGDTINTASRMCMYGAINRIHVSSATHHLLHTKYLFESRGEITVKGKGVMHTYFLDGRRPQPFMIPLSAAITKSASPASAFAQASAQAHASMTAIAAMQQERRLTAASTTPVATNERRLSSPSDRRMSDAVYGLGNLPEFSGARTHRTGSHGGAGGAAYATRPVTAGELSPNNLSKASLSRFSWKYILKKLGTPEPTQVQSVEESQEEAFARYDQNMFTLLFQGDVSIEQDYQARNSTVHHTRMCCAMLFTLIGFAFCGLYDYYFAKGAKYQYYVFRYLMVLAGIVCIGLAIRFRRFVEFITLGVQCGIYFGTLALEIWGHHDTPLGLTTVILVMYISSMTFNVSCVRFLFACITHLIGFTLFQFLQLLQNTPARDMGLHSSFVVFGLLMNVVSCYMQERYERNNWVHELLLDDEIDKTDALLTGLLPVSVLVELKEGRQLIADEFEQVSIMMTDVVGFTEIASRISPSQLVDMLNVLFSVFDKLAQKYGVLKIATIGDAYLCIAGCPEKSDDHAARIASMALEMLEKVKEIFAVDGSQVRVRIGMHTGPVIAGVVGIKMIHYQIWGDSVQIAQKMESSGKPSHIHVSDSTYALLQNDFELEPAEVVKIKNTDMATYFLKARKTEKEESEEFNTPVITVKKGLKARGPAGTPRMIDLSSSMIFQNAGAWSKQPASPTLPSSSSPQPSSGGGSLRLLSAKRYARTPRRVDILTPLPTHRVRKMSMLVPNASPLEMAEVSDLVPPSFILDNILGINNNNLSNNEKEEFGPLDDAILEDDGYYNFDDDVMSSGDDSFSSHSLMVSGNSTVTNNNEREREGEEEEKEREWERGQRGERKERVPPFKNFSFGSGLRLNSIVLPPAPSGPNLAYIGPNSEFQSPNSDFQNSPDFPSGPISGPNSFDNNHFNHLSNSGFTPSTSPIRNNSHPHIVLSPSSRPATPFTDNNNDNQNNNNNNNNNNFNDFNNDYNNNYNNNNYNNNNNTLLKDSLPNSQ